MILSNVCGKIVVTVSVCMCKNMLNAVCSLFTVN